MKEMETEMVTAQTPTPPHNHNAFIPLSKPDANPNAPLASPTPMPEPSTLSTPIAPDMN